MVDPDLELRKGGGGQTVLFCLSCRLFVFIISSRALQNAVKVNICRNLFKAIETDSMPSERALLSRGPFLEAPGN